MLWYNSGNYSITSGAVGGSRSFNFFVKYAQMSFTLPILGFLLHKLLYTSLQVEVSPKMIPSTLFLDLIGTSTVWWTKVQHSHVAQRTEHQPNHPFFDLLDLSIAKINYAKFTINKQIAKINSAKLTVFGPANR